LKDNGDGTITDAETGLMWEKKDQSGSLHDQSNEYIWSSSGTAPDGPLFTTFLAGLNLGAGFAGHTDWRIPTIAELETIIDYTVFAHVAAPFNSACVASCSVTTCSCTAASGYWSSTSLVGSPFYAWGVIFAPNGLVLSGDKAAVGFARSVRGGF
jgi:hypothetical protein